MATEAGTPVSLRLKSMMYVGSDARRYLSGPWRTLYADDPRATPFQSPGWYLGWLRTVGASSGVMQAVLVVRRGDRDAAALALQFVQEDRSTTLTALTAPWADYARPIGWLSEDPAVCVSLIDGLADAVPPRGIVTIAELAADSAIAAMLGQAADWQGTICSRTAQLRLPGGWADLPSRGEYARKLGRLRARGTVRVVHTNDQMALRAALERLMVMHAEQWAARPDVVAPFTDPVVTVGYRDLAAEVDPAEMVISELTLDGRVLATYLGFARNRCYYAYRPAMDLRERRNSPGHLLLLHMLRDFAARGDVVFDLTRGEYQYKNAYADHWRDNLAFTYRAV